MGDRKLVLEQFPEFSVVRNLQTTDSNNKCDAHYSKSNKGGLVHEI